MVSFTELYTLIQPNKTKEETLPVWTVVEPVRVWKLPPTSRVDPPTLRVDPPTLRVDPPTSRVDPPTLRPYGRPIDILSIGIQDPLYNRAPRNTARDIEIEEAIRLEEMIPILYGREGGRSRGWTKKLLETHLHRRAAVGGDLFELQKATLGINGHELFTCKEASALFDFLCLAKGIRCVVWKDSLHFGLWPAAEPAILSKEPRLFHACVNEAGEIRLANGCDTIEQLFTWVDSTSGVGWTPALSCLSILASHTMEELKHAADAIGLVVTGKKSEQIIQIAAARRRRSISFSIQ